MIDSSSDITARIFRRLDAFFAGAGSYGAQANRSSEIETRLARHDLKNIYKEDLPTPCMIVDQAIFDPISGKCRSTAAPQESICAVTSRYIRALRSPSGNSHWARSA